MNRMLWIKLERIIMREKIFKWKKKQKSKTKKKKQKNDTWAHTKSLTIYLMTWMRNKKKA